MIVEQWLLEKLRCPLGGAPLLQSSDRLTCSNCGVVFPVRDGVLVLLMIDAMLPAGIDRIEQLACFGRQRRAEGRDSNS